MLRRDVFRAAGALLTGGAPLIRAGNQYDAEVAEWRKNYDRDLRSEKGPLFLVGRHRLPEGRTAVGSEPSSGIALPERAPRQVGWVEVRGDKVVFVPAAGASIRSNGKPMVGQTALRTGIPPEARDRIEFGDFELSVSLREGICELMIRDRQSPYLKQFHGAVWFPVNPKYRVEATFTAYPEPKQLRIPDTTGHARSMQAPGYVTFRLNGETLRLEPVLSGNGLFFMFKDLTSGHQTYGAGRFLEAEMPKGGKVVLDFNKAYNPYCAFNPYSSCPIPPKENKLTMRIEAGEKHSGAPH
jgi:uncharacterized protein (DUF1684 family)